MKFSVITLFFALLGSALSADELPTLTDKPWLGTYLGYRDRGFDFSLTTNGKSQLFLKEKKERTDARSYFSIQYILEEQFKDGKWGKRQMAKDGFTYTHDPSAELEESVVTATFTGDTKVAIKHEFERGIVKIRGKVVEKTTKNPLRFRVQVTVPYLWKNRKGGSLSEDDVEETFEKNEKIKDSHMRAVRISDDKRVKFNFWESVKLMDEDAVGPEGAKEVLVDGDKYFGGRRVNLTTGNPSIGPLILENRGDLYSGMTVSWISPEEELGKPDNYLSLEIK